MVAAARAIQQGTVFLLEDGPDKFEFMISLLWNRRERNAVVFRGKEEDSREPVELKIYVNSISLDCTDHDGIGDWWWFSGSLWLGNVSMEAKGHYSFTHKQGRIEVVQVYGSA